MHTNAIVFDLDGTLINSSSTILDAFNYALNHFGHHATYDDLERMRSLTEDELFLDILPPDQAKIAVARLWEYSRHSAKETILFDGIVDMLEKIHSSHIKLGLWTGRDHGSTFDILETHKLQHYFAAIVSGSHVKKNKPDPEGLLLLADKLHIQPANIMHIGDHAHDIIGASSAGAKTVHVIWEPENPGEPVHHPKADFKFTSISTLSNWIDVHMITI